MRIKIPFNDRFIMPMVSGNKIMTTRSKRYGTIGDTFWVKGIRYKIKGVCKRELGEITTKWYKEEGFKTPKEFRDFWLTGTSS